MKTPSKSEILKQCKRERLDQIKQQEAEAALKDYFLHQEEAQEILTSAKF